MKRLIFILLLIAALIGCKSGPDYVNSDSLWMSGDEVKINNLYPGYQGSMEFEIGIGRKSEPREIHVSIQPEDDDDLGGWVQLPEEYYSWFTILPSVFVLKPGDSQIVNVDINVPEDVDYPGKKARCELLAKSWAIVGQTTNESGETVNLVRNIAFGVASEWYIKTY